MEERQFTPYDQLPPVVALNPYVREIYVRLKLVEDGKRPMGSTPRREKTKIDWKILVIVVCLAGSGYIYYNMFFASRSGGAALPGIDPGEMQRLEVEMTALQEKIKTQTGPEKEASEKQLLQLQNNISAKLSGLVPQMILAPGGGAPGGQTPPEEPTAH